MKNIIKKTTVAVLLITIALSSVMFFGCGENGQTHAPVSVKFVQNGEEKANISVDYGKKIDEKNVVKPESEKEDCVTEWNFDFNMPVYENLTVNTVFYTKGLIFSKSLKGDYYLVSGYNGKSQNIFLPDCYKGGYVKSIKAEAFMRNETIVSVRFPSQLVSVADGAFKGCHGLTEAILPDTVTTIGASAFEDCSSLVSFNIPPLVEVVSSRAAQGHIYDFLAIPEGVKVIESYAFANNMSEVVLPVSLKRIECVGLWANLRRIFYCGSEYDWLKVDVSDEPYIGTGGFTFSAKSVTTEIATLYYYSESAPVRPGNYWHYVSGKPEVWE